jgi:hypothetical protein
LTKRMFTLITSMGHKRHMVLLVVFFYWNDHFDQMLNRTSSQKGHFKKMIHQDHLRDKMPAGCWSRGQTQSIL